MNEYLEQIDDQTNGTAQAQFLEESQKLRHTNKLLEKQVKAHTSALKQSYEQLEKEIAERIKTEKKLQQRIIFDDVLKSISSNFINLTIHDIDEGINEALIDVAAFNQFERAYIYMLEENGRSLKNTHGWQKKDYPTNIQDFSNFPVNLFQNWLPRLQTQETLIIKNILEPDKEISSERKLLALQGAKLALIVPLIFGHETIGFLGFDSSNPSFTWKEESIDAIKMVGSIFVNALMRKKAEEALVEKHNFAQQIMGTMGQGLFVTTVEGAFEYINPACAEMLGYQPEELIGKTPLDITFQEDHAKLIQAQMQNLEGVATAYESRLTRADGSWLYAMVNSVPNQNRQGQMTGTISTVTDLTERRNIEAQTKANADEMKLIYNAAVQLFQPSSVQALAEQITSIIIDDFGFDACGVLLLRKPLPLHTNQVNRQSAEHDNYLTWLARIGRFYNDREGKIFLNEAGLVTTAVCDGQNVYVPDVSRDTRYVPDNTYTQSEMVIPLRAYNKIIGAIDLQSPHKNAFDDRIRRIVTLFAENAGLALETVRLYDRMQHHNRELELQISERKRIEQALRASEQRYKQLVENATDMIYRTDVEGYCTYANPVTMRTLGYTNEEEIIGQHFTDFIHPDFKATVLKAYSSQQMEQRQNTYLEFIALDKNKREIWLGQNVQLSVEQGQVMGFQALARDITKRRKAEEKLRIRSNELNANNAKLAKILRAKDEFLANMSHELRTPLNAILGKAEILLEGIHGELTEKQASSLQIIEDSGNHLLELINDVLDIAKIEAGKIQLDIQKVPIAELCESSLQFVRQMAHKKQIRLQANIDYSLKTCQADRRRLKQILINLLSNAVKFTPSGGEVGLNVLSDPDRNAVQFQVWDTGIGISPENMGQLFRPFEQLNSSLDCLHKGTGLGLPLVYRLTEMHGGGLSVESQVGVGSCFVVSLPQTEASKDRHQISTRPLNNYLPGREPLILLVDDNHSHLETVSEYLPVCGYRLKVIHSENDVLQQAHKRLPDLILIDIQIPGMEGLTAVRHLRNEQAFSKTPIIALTALTMQGDRDRFLEAGVNECLSKPIQFGQLVELIEKLLTDNSKQTKEQGHE